MGGDDYIEALGGDDEIYGGDGDEDIRIQAGNSKIYGGLGWDTLEIDDKTSDYVTITYTDGENGIVQGYNSDGVELYISEFESINRIVQVSEIDFRFSGGENNDTVKLYELPLANPEDGYFSFDGGVGKDKLQLYNLPMPTDGDNWPSTTSTEFNEYYAFEHISGSISDFELLDLSSGEILGIFNSFEQVQFDDSDFSLMEFASNTIGGVTINGTAAREEIFGSSGSDTIYGGGGDDQIFGGAGDDQIFGQDIAIESSGEDWVNIQGGAGKDIIYFTNPNHSGMNDEPFRKKGSAQYDNQSPEAFSATFDTPIQGDENTGGLLEGVINGQSFTASFGEFSDDRAIFITDLEDLISVDTLVGVSQIEEEFSGTGSGDGGRIHIDIDWENELLTPFVFLEGQENIFSLDIPNSGDLRDWYTNDTFFGSDGDDRISVEGGGTDRVEAGAGDDSINTDAWQLIYNRESTSYIDGGIGFDTVHVDTIGGSPGPGAFVIEFLSAEQDSNFSSYRLYVDPEGISAPDGYDETRDFTIYLDSVVTPGEGDAAGSRSGYVVFTNQPDITITTFDNVELLEFNDLWSTTQNGGNTDRWARFDLTGDQITAELVREGEIVNYNDVDDYFGFEIVSGGSGDDYLIGGLESDYISTYGGNDVVFALDGDDIIEISGSGNVVVETGSGNDEVIIEEGTTGSIEIDAGGPGDSLYWEDAPSFGQYAYIDDAGALRFGASMSAEEGAESLDVTIHNQMVLDEELGKYVVSDNGIEDIIIEEDGYATAVVVGSDFKEGDVLYSMGHDVDENFIYGGQGADTIRLLGGADQSQYTRIAGDDYDLETGYTTNRSFGDELIIDWARADVEITELLEGWYEIEYTGTGEDAGKIVEFSGIEKLVFTQGDDAPLEIQVIDGPVVGSADWFESGGSWLGAAAGQDISFEDNNVEFRVSGNTVKVYSDIIETTMEMQIVTETYKDSRGRTKTRKVEKEVAVEHIAEDQLIWEGDHNSISGLEFADGHNVNVISIREQDIGGNEIKMTFGSDAMDLIFGTEGSNIIYGAGGDDIIVGGGGDDVVLGGTGEDVILGGDGDDLLLGDLDEDMMRDELEMSEEDIAAILAEQQLDDGSSNDLIIGGDGIDHVDGGDGENVVVSGGVDNLDINQDGEANIHDIEDLVGKDIFEDDSWA